MLGRYQIISLDPFEQPQGGNGSKQVQLEQWGAVSSPNVTEKSNEDNQSYLKKVLQL